MRKNTGFTLIELIMVISILGILAAVAVPKFVDLGGDARKAAVKTWAGAIRSVMGMAHSTFLATNATPVTVDGVSIAIAGGYPAANATGIAAGLIDNTDMTVVCADSACTFTHTTAPGLCNVTYTLQNSRPPTVVIVDTGC